MSAGIISERKIRKNERPPLGNPWSKFTEIMKRPFLTERDKEVLLAVYKQRCLTSGQISEIYFKFDRYGGINRSAEVLARRRLKKLYKNHLIDRFFIDVGQNNGSSQQHVTLDEVGSFIIAGLLNCEVEELKWNKEHNEVRLPYLQHMVAINDFYVSLLCWARRFKKEKHAVPEFMVENLVRQAFTYRGENCVFTPDAYGQYCIGEEGVHFFLEIDRGTMTSSQFVQKVSRYAKFYGSDAYVTDYETFPLIMVVTTNWERAKMLKSVVENADHTDLAWLFSTFDLTKEAMHQNIWLKAHSQEPVSFLNA